MTEGDAMHLPSMDRRSRYIVRRQGFWDQWLPERDELAYFNSRTLECLARVWCWLG